MIAVDISRHFVFSTKKRNIQSKLWRWIALQLVLWILTWTSSVYIQPASRRMVSITGVFRSMLYSLFYVGEYHVCSLGVGANNADFGFIVCRPVHQVTCPYSIFVLTI